MNCEVFQEKINDFIFDRIEYSEDLEDFLSHAKECKDCMEELQLYYTIHRGLEDVPAPFEGEETKKAEEELQEMTDGLELGFTRQDIGGLYLNIVFENGKLNCITGTSLNIFTMDKTLERVWDKRVAIELEGTEKDENINKV